MAIKQTYFIPFHLFSSEEYTGQCAAYKSSRNKGRCTSTPGSDLIKKTKINELHAQLQSSYENRTGDEDKEKMLKELAGLTICGRQKKVDGAIEDAVRQWNSELKTQDSPAVCPATPARNVNAQSKKDEGSPKLEFTPYKTDDMDKYIVGKLNEAAGRDSSMDSDKEKRDHLYIFECDDAKGMCKLGYSSSLTRRAREQEKCYPNTTERRSLYCPNPDIFEKVVHRELSQDRYKHKCGRCNVTHNEWFKADLDELYRRVKVWCQFSQGFQDPEKRVDVRIPPPELPSGPDRWYKWAQKWVQDWEKQGLHSEPNTSDTSAVHNAIMAVEALNLDDDAESVPGLSPSSSVSGIPGDDYIDPPTPTPIERSRNGKSLLKNNLIIPTASPSMSSEEYWTAVESLSTHKGSVLFPQVPGGYPASPVKVTTNEDDNGLVGTLENMALR
ncbi:hypothetical protein BDV32DRAFT_145551 [Aspergillus pseudonomiae]|uniref:Uncharacterized protein n=1 Tax=Aspergillus pseudonomiae TaxID=1506151 RepID=A0A5N7DRR6_9EURO|nr:uncharacterized protein BDV37DRAFT_278123 [Aspergillus pseudonomiae]KAB8264303.1 hypothetical protein BDV32DRAFT_145551 [Aspergillus pseudonomiae]KAE8409151.1 hypothetical protein BDV37DRAFT_278123 [Aspergillus pseudonomiae]